VKYTVQNHICVTSTKLLRKRNLCYNKEQVQLTVRKLDMAFLFISVALSVRGIFLCVQGFESFLLNTIS
jgi:hypothetical protein